MLFGDQCMYCFNLGSHYGNMYLQYQSENFYFQNNMVIDTTICMHWELSKARFDKCVFGQYFITRAQGDAE